MCVVRGHRVIIIHYGRGLHNYVTDTDTIVGSVQFDVLSTNEVLIPMCIH